MARYFFSSRFGGFSSGSFESLNLGDHVGDQPATVAQNRDYLREQLSLSELIFMHQSHGTDICVVEGPGVYNADALITQKKGLGVAVLTADCIPLLIYGESAVAAVHVGRKGFLAGIVSKTVDQLREYGAHYFATLGPAICGTCYEVPLDMYQSATSSFPSLATSDSTHALDLPAGVIAELAALGISARNTHRCTQESDEYFSYRRSNTTGRLAGVVSL